MPERITPPCHCGHSTLEEAHEENGGSQCINQPTQK